MRKPFFGDAISVVEEWSAFPYKKRQGQRKRKSRRRYRVLGPSSMLPWESIELDCNWLKRVPFAHESPTHRFFPSHVPSCHFTVLFIWKISWMHWWKTSCLLLLFLQWYIVLCLHLWVHFTVHIQNLEKKKKVPLLLHAQKVQTLREKKVNQ